MNCNYSNQVVTSLLQKESWCPRIGDVCQNARVEELVTICYDLQEFAI